MTIELTPAEVATLLEILSKATWATDAVEAHQTVYGIVQKLRAAHLTAGAG